MPMYGLRFYSVCLVVRFRITSAFIEVFDGKCSCTKNASRANTRPTRPPRDRATAPPCKLRCIFIVKARTWWVGSGKWRTLWWSTPVAPSNTRWYNSGCLRKWMRRKGLLVAVSGAVLLRCYFCLHLCVSQLSSELQAIEVRIFK